MRVDSGKLGLFAVFLALTGSMMLGFADPPGAPVPEPATSVPVLDVQVDTRIKQGEAVRVQGKGGPLDNATVKLGKRTAKLFRQADGSYLALVPVSVFQAPGKYPLTIVASDGTTVKSVEVDVQNAHYRTQNIRVSKSTGGLQPEPGELETVQKLKDTVTPVRYWQEPFISPTGDCQNSPFGVKRYHNGKATGDYHKGVDLRSPAGRPILATNDGKVQIARTFRLHGGTVGLDHGQGVSSIYIHMSRIDVKPGDVVKKGDVIGRVGATGFATGPHLHWGLYVNGLPINPNQWITHVPQCG